MHLHLLVCYKGNLCVSDTCIGAGYLMELIDSQQPQRSTEKKLYKKDNRYYLQRDLETGKLTVMDSSNLHVASDIKEIIVINHDGQIEMICSDATEFDVGNLPNAEYRIFIIGNDGNKELLTIKKE